MATESPNAAEALRLAREQKEDDSALKEKTDCSHGCTVPALRPPCEHGYSTAALTLYMEEFKKRHGQ